MSRENPRTVILLGASGFIGSRIKAALEQSGHVVLCAGRSRTRSTIQIDLRDEGQIRDTLANIDFDVLVNCAGVATGPNLFAVNAEALVPLCAIAEAKHAHLVHLSSVGSFGPSSADVVTECSPRNPENDYERSKYAGELVVEASNVVSTTLQPTMSTDLETFRVHFDTCFQ